MTALGVAAEMPQEAPSAPPAGLDPDVADIRAAAKASREQGLVVEPPAESGEALQTEAPTEAPAAEEPATQVAPAADEPKETALFLRAMKEREKNVRQLEEIRAARATFEREKATFEREKAEIAEHRAKLARIKEDPWAYFDEFEVDRNEFARRLMTLTTPEAVELDKVRKEALDAKRRVEEWEKKQEEERQRQHEERSHGEVQRQVQAAKDEFSKFVEAKADAYPEIAYEDPAELTEVMWELATRHHKLTGSTPTYEMVAEYMNRTAREKREKREARRTQRSAPASSANPATSPRTESDGHPQTSPGPRTLTNGTSTQRTVVPPDADDIDAWSVRELRAARRKTSGAG